MRHPAYLIGSARKCLLRKGYACPSCGGRRSDVVDRKWVVTALRRCRACRLLFRTPTTTAAENEAIYQATYAEGFTTDLPDPDTLARYTAANFKGTEKDYTRYLEVLEALGGRPGQRVYDFGSSWGYGSYQLRAAGYAVDSYEISRPRAAFARDELGATLVEPDQAADRAYDVFFSAHVIEHVPSVADMIALALRVLKPGGLMLTFTPNGGAERRAADPDGWHRAWGFVHPQLIDREYVEARFAGHEYVIASDPYPLDRLREFPAIPALVLPLTGPELMFAVRPPAAGAGDG